MATTIVTKNSSVALSAPSAGQLVQGELAINVTDKKIYTLDGGGNVVLLAAGGSPYVTPQVIQLTDNTYPALRITQLGTAAALLIEDSSNPDATPFVVDASGNVGIGVTTTSAKLHVNNIGAGDSLLVEDSANPDSTPFVISASGAVGIGTTTPPQKLSVYGGNAVAMFVDSGTDNTIAIFNSDNAQANLDIRGSGARFRIGASGTGEFFLSTGTTSTYTERMRIDSSGTLDVNGTINGYVIGPQGLADSESAPGLYVYNDPDTGFFRPASNTIGISTGGTERLRIDSDGDVGINTTNPTSLLQTAGTSAKSAFKTPNIAEVNTVSATAATGTINYDVTTQSVLYYTTNASGNFTVNFRGSSGTSLNTVMQTGESISVTFLVTNGTTAYYNSAVQVDGSSVTPKWQNGIAPTTGNASSIDSYTYVIIKTGSAAFTVLATQTKFA